MLNSFYICASEKTVEPLLNFDDIYKKIQSYKNKDLATAIKFSLFYETKIFKFSVEERINFKTLQAELHNNNNDFKRAIKAANAGLELTKNLSKPSISMAELFSLRGVAIESTGDYESALKDYKAALEIAESLGDDAVVIQTLTDIGSIYYAFEEYQLSLKVLNNALSLAQSLKSDKHIGFVYLALGTLYQYLQLEDKVKEFYALSYQYFNKANESYLAIEVLADITAINNDPEQAIKLYKQVIIETKKLGDSAKLTQVYSKIAEAYLQKTPTEPNTAYRFILMAEKQLNLVKKDGLNILFLVNKADVLTHLNRFDGALQTIKNAEAILPAQVNVLQTFATSQLLRIKSELFYAMGSYEKAYYAQHAFHLNTIKRRKAKNLQKLDGLRIQYESQQHETMAGVLEKKKLLQSLALNDVSKSYLDRAFYIFTGIVTIFFLICFYFINLNNQKRLLNGRQVDHLTGLPNRQKISAIGSRGFNQLSKRKKEYSVLIIKIDNFNTINQVKGYGLGNNIIIEISSIISQIIGEKIQYGRYSTDEFLVLLPHYSPENGDKLATKIQNNVYKKYWDQYGLKVVSVNIGVSNNISDQIDSSEMLIKHARGLNKKAVTSEGVLHE